MADKNNNCRNSTEKDCCACSEKHKERSPEERSEIAKAGGQASGKAKREKKRAKEILDIFLAMPLRKRAIADIQDIQSYEQLKGKNITVNEAIQLKQVQRALSGDLSSATYIRDTIGEKPTEKVEAKVNDPFAGLTTEELRKIVENAE